MWRRAEEPKAQTSPEPAPVAPTVTAETPRPSPERAGAAPRAESARITQAISIRGDITGREDLFVDGELQGSIQLSGASVVIGPNGRVRARVEASEIVVDGSVEGDLVGRERVNIRKSGSVTGKVLTPRVNIEEGAFLRGSVEMTRAGEALPSRPEKAAAAAAASAGGGELRTPLRADAPDSVN